MKEENMLEYNAMAREEEGEGSWKGGVGVVERWGTQDEHQFCWKKQDEKYPTPLAKKKVSQKKGEREKENVTNEMALDLPTIDQTKRVTPDTIQYPTACKIP